MNLEKQNFQNKTIYQLIAEDGRELKKEKEILQEIRQFYDQLYTWQGNIDKHYLQTLQIPQISKEIRELEMPITQEEVGVALLKLANGKCPSTDGLDASFYKVFYPLLKDFLVDLFNEVVREGKLHRTARESIVSLIEKIYKDPLRLKC